MKTAKFISITLAVIFLLIGNAEALNPGSTLKKLRKRYRKVTSLRADFREIFEWSMTGETTIRMGKLLVTNDNRFRIETPEQLLIADGKDIYRYNRVKEQVIIEPIGSDGEQFLPSKLLLDFADGFNAMTITEIAVDGREGLRLDLKANDPDVSLMSSAVIWITSDDLVVHRLKLIDLNSNSTTYFLSDIIFDQSVEASETLFTPPEGVELFDLR